MKKKIHKILRDNAGSSLVIVIIAVAFVGILGATILWMSLNNYYMKMTDTRHKNSFYSAETVMEQIVAGLQKDASDAVDVAYADVMQKYSTYSAMSETDAENARRTTFTTAYLATLQKRLEGATTDKFDISILQSYVSAGLLNGTTRVLSSADCDMVKYDSYIVLEDVNLSFVDDNGFLSKITTDIVLDTPSIDFALSSTMPEVFTYSLISDEAIQDTVTNNTEITGNIYAGDKGITISGKCQIKDADRVVTDAEIITAQPSSVLQLGGVADADDVPAVWAQGLRMEKGSMTVHGKAYIADDLTIDGHSTAVTLEKEYYGYGNSTDNAKKSSAIVINGTNSSLDLSGVDKLLLAGHSYIGTGSAVAEINPSISQNEFFVDNSDIMMGESIAVKGNQIAYLVPDECIDVFDGVASGSNPMSMERDAQIRANELLYQNSTEHTYSAVDFNKILSGRNVPLNAYTSRFQRIYCPWTGTSDALVYYYLVMDEAAANSYFENYYGYKKEKLDQYFDIYTNGGIKSNAGFTRINLQGNWLASEAVTGTTVLNAATPMATTDLNTESERYENMFAALKTKLITNYLEITPAERTKSVFENLIEVSDLEAFCAANGDMTDFITVDGFHAIVTKNDYAYDASSPQDTRLIISLGDVHVAKNFTGLIMAKGEITIDSSASLISSAWETTRKEELTKALNCEKVFPAGTVKPIDFFVNGGDYILNGTLVNPVSEEDAVKEPAVDFSTVVKYENWLKH